MRYLVNIYYQAQIIRTSTFATEGEAVNYADEIIDERIDDLPRSSRGWGRSVYSSVITPMQQTILPNYNL